MQPNLTTIALLTRELSLTIQDVLAWLPTIPARRATSAELATHCRRLRHQLARVRRHHKPAWELFAVAAGRDGFRLWDGDRTESAHQAVATLGQRLYQLLGGRAVARGGSGAAARAQLLRLELHLPRLASAALPGFDLGNPSLPLGLFQALAWELRTAAPAIEPVTTRGADESATKLGPGPEVVPESEWEQLGQDRQGIFDRLYQLNQKQASAKEILGSQPSKGQQSQLQKLVKMGFFRKPGKQGQRGIRGYAIGRVPQGYVPQK